MQARLPDAGQIRDARRDLLGPFAPSTEDADLGELAEVPHQRAERHGREQCLPDGPIVFELRRHHLVSEAVGQNELSGVLGGGRDLQLLEGPNALGEFPDPDLPVEGLDALSDDVPLSERARARHRPADERLLLSGEQAMAGVRLAKDVPVTPAAPLAVLGELIGELFRRLARVPGADRATELRAPAPERIHVAHELEQVTRGPAHERQRIEGQLAGHGRGVGGTECQREQRRALLRRAAPL